MSKQELDDRRVHGLWHGWAIVRYEKAGKWYAERQLHPRELLTVTEAATRLAHPEADWFEGVPGGQRLDSTVRKIMDGTFR